MNDIKVSVICITYNHEKYIKDALESFLMQKTNFYFEILLHDDSSTDKTAEIIKEYETKYPNIIKPVYQTENQYSKGVEILYTYNFTRSKGKYIALCEGDDYWIDPYKLEKQVDYMENNPQCSLCVHSAEKVSSNKKHIGKVMPNKCNKLYSTDDIILGGGGIFATNSMFFPIKLVRKVPEFYLKCPVGDYPLTIYLSLKGYVFYIADTMSAYRVMTENSWSNRMHGNMEKYTEHIRLIEMMLNHVDEYSNYVHTEAIKKHILENRFNLMIDQGKFKEFKNDKYYREFYLNLNRKNKAKVILKQYLPWSINFFRYVKERFIDG